MMSAAIRRTRVTASPTLVLVLVLASACGPRDFEKETPEIRSEIEEGTVSPLVLALRNYRADPSGNQSFSIIGTHEGRPVGLDLEFGKWHENPPGFVNMTTHSCAIRARSRGKETEEFVRALDAIYGTRSAPRQFAPEIELQGFSPWAKPGQFEGDPVHMVLIFPASIEENEEPQVFFEVDRENSRVEWKEKQSRYRRGVVRAFGLPE